MRSLAALTLTIALLSAGCGRKHVPPGSLKAAEISFEYAIFYLPTPTHDPQSLVERMVRERFPVLRVTPRMEKDVRANYAPPDAHALTFFARGLSEQQKLSLQASREALVLDFVHPQKDVWRALRQATQLTAEVARATGGLIWDEESREVFTPDAWVEQRLSRWTEEMPELSDHITIHNYKDGDYVRAVSLGMSKFGLPDLVVNGFAWSLERTVGHTMNMLAQLLAEGAMVGDNGRLDLDIRKIRNAAVREPQVTTLGKNATGIARLVLLEGKHEEGDADNRLVEIAFDEYAGRDVHARQDRMLSELFGSEDHTSYVDHSEKVLEASRAARGHLPELRSSFNAGLPPGEYILLKAPFKTDDGGNEWMWVEVTRWNGDTIEGLLRNDPDKVSTLQAGQIVTAKESEIFDYIVRHADGSSEGNTTGAILQEEEQST